MQTQPQTPPPTSNAAQNGYLISFLAAITWSLTGPGVKYVNDVFHFHPLSLAFWRVVFIAGALLIGVTLIKRSLLRVTAQQLRWLALAGIIGIGIYQAIFVYSISLNGAAVGIVLVYVFPVFVTLGSWLFFKERMGVSQIIALIISVMGCALLVRAYDPAVFQLNAWGALVGLLSALAHATYTLISRHMSSIHNTDSNAAGNAVGDSVSNTSPATTLTYTFGFGFLTLAVLVLVAAREATFAINPNALPAVAVLSLGPTLGGYVLFNLALTKLPSPIVSLIVVAEAPIATIIGVGFMGEHLEPLQVVGIALILVAIVLPSLLNRLAASQALRALNEG